VNVDDVVAAKVEAARRRIARERAERIARRQARAAGLAQRHAAKLRHLARPETPTAAEPSVCPQATPGLSNAGPLEPLNEEELVTDDEG
jgi:hypothetical protein